MLGRYEIQSHLGEGGMGVVYRARDSRLGREVAIKVLNEEAAESPARIDRFVQEARSVARLSHPNILDIHDFGTHDGINYAVTEFLQGKTLRDRLAKGPMPIDKGLKVCGAIAEGLAAAHGEGIIHRDIKPSNIFITDTGQVKILDFGIARLREDPAEEGSDESQAPTRSSVGSTRMAGTSGYMSPEQIEGGVVDGRSDIFGLGCVMYEVLTGQRAFRRVSAADTMLSILQDDPEPIGELRPEIPQPVEAIVERCLEKQPGERFESVRDVAFALRAMSERGGRAPPVRPVISNRTRRLAVVTAGAGALFVIAMFLGSKLDVLRSPPPPILPDSKHVAIVPFEATGEDQELIQFAAGMTETLAEDLELLVQSDDHDSWVVPTSRTSGTVDVDYLFRRFNANVVLTGVVERNGPLLDLKLTSIEPESGRSFRSTEIEADLGNVSSLQIIPIERVAELVGLDLTDDHRQVFSDRTTSVARAFDLYLRARGLLAANAENRDAETAVTLLDESVKLDPLFVPAREALTGALALAFKDTDNQVYFDRGVEVIEGLAPNSLSARVLRSQAELLAAQGDRERAAGTLERAAELAPKSGETFHELGAVYQGLGRFADAERAYHRAINLRPGFWLTPDALGRMYFGQGRYDEAANSFRHVIECVPRSTVGYNVLGVIQFLQDDLEASRLTFERSVEVDSTDNYFALSNLGTLHFNAARFADAITVYERALVISDSEYEVWGNLAFAYAFGAEPEKARTPFERAIELAEEVRTNESASDELLADLAGFYAMVDQAETSRDLLVQVIALEPDDPQVHAKIGETFEDLKDREAALEWIGRAIEGGIPPRLFESRPMLRDLVADPRYRILTAADLASPG